MKRIGRFLSGAAGLALMISFLQYSSTDVSADVTSVKGDLNGDGVVDVMDRIYLKKHLISDSMCFPVTNWRKAADVNNDSNIDYNDLNKLRDYMLKCDEESSDPMSIVSFDGIDVSKWQGDINWEQVKAAGIDFVMIKAGEGVETESCFLKNIEGAKNAGVQCGIYWFANARSVQDAHKEAEACLQVISRYKLEYPVVYDFEYRTLENGNPLAKDRKLCTETINTFLNDIESAGWYAMVYTNKDFPQRYLNIDDITSRYSLWYANYSISQPDTPCSIWQYSCTGRVDGIMYDVDLDVSFVDFKSKIMSLGLNGYDKPSVPSEEEKPADPDNDKNGSETTDQEKQDDSDIMINISDIINNSDFWNEGSLKECGTENGIKKYQGNNYGIMITVEADEKTGKVVSAEAEWGENESELIKNNDLYNITLRSDVQRILTGLCGYEKSEALSLLKNLDLSENFNMKDIKGYSLSLSHETHIVMKIRMK